MSTAEVSPDASNGTACTKAETRTVPNATTTELASPSCVATFNSTVVDLVTELKGTFPELVDIINERYGIVAPDDASLLEWFEANAKEHQLKLTTKDESVFKSNASLFLLPDINFCQLWKCKLTKSNKNAIWKYLHVLLLLVSHHQMQGVTQSVLDQATNAESTPPPAPVSMQATFEQWNNMLDDEQMAPEELQAMREQSEKILKLMETLHSTDETMEDEGSDNCHPDGEKSKAPSMEDIKNDPFVRQLENSKIAQFAKELTQELDMNDFGLGVKPDKVESFQDVFGMMGKDPQKMFGLVKTVGDKIQNKMQSGDIKQSELLIEAQNLMKSMQTSDTFKQMFKDGKSKRGKGGGMDPHTLFKEMTKHIDPAMMQQAMSMMGGMQCMPGVPSHNATRARLQQKVAQNSGSAPAATALTANATHGEPISKPTGKKKKKKKKTTKPTSSS